MERYVPERSPFLMSAEEVAEMSRLAHEVVDPINRELTERAEREGWPAVPHLGLAWPELN